MAVKVLIITVEYGSFSSQYYQAAHSFRDDGGLCCKHLVTCGAHKFTMCTHTQILKVNLAK